MSYNLKPLADGSVQYVGDDGLSAWKAMPVSQMEAGAGITTGTGTIYRSGVTKHGGIITTEILIDITGLSSNVLGDIIGKAATASCHLGQFVGGTVLTGTMTCMEAPLTGEPDIDLWVANESTGAEDSAISALTGEAVIVTSGADWSLGLSKHVVAAPGANQYFYLVGGGGTTDAVYTAGKFLITMQGYE